MDNHPIPQDVTSFQFRLIGDMTLKQFGYVLAGVIFAWIALTFPVFFLLRLVLAGGFVLTGVVLAFVPIDGRPADLMLLHFIKALFNPTQYVYQKTARVQSTPTTTVTPKAPDIKIPEKKEEPKQEKVQVESFAPVATAAVAARVVDERPQPPTPIMQQAPITQPSAQTAAKQDQKLQEEVTTLAHQLEEAKAQESKEQNTPQAALSHEKVSTLETELQEIMQQKAELEKQLVTLQKSLAEKKQQVFSPSSAQAPTQETQHVKKLPKQMTVSAGAPLVPDFPNLLSGVVKDPRGNVLTNILIEVKDKDGTPVRAFKTNQLGQFTAATPLVNGTYTVSFEDSSSKQSFDAVEVIADGTNLPPLEIISVDAREKLRQELFGQAT